LRFFQICPILLSAFILSRITEQAVSYDDVEVIGLFFVSIRRNRKDHKEDRAWIQQVCLALLFLIGSAGGYLYAVSCVKQSSLALLEYLDGYCQLFLEGEKGSVSFISAFVLYFGHTFLVFLFGFSALGIFTIPVVVAECGFSAMFAIACILHVYGRKGILMALICVGIRLFVVLPCVIWGGSHAWIVSASRLPYNRGKRTTENRSGYVPVFCTCCVVLLIGVVIECSVTPEAFSWVLPLMQK